jgi:hypothetical protein
MDTYVDTPSLPAISKKNVVFYSLFTILWWVAIWGLSETLMTYMVKNSLVQRAAIYAGLLLLVFVIMLIDPQLVEYL